MKVVKRILGSLIILAGIASILVANYIKQQVAEGKIKIANAQEKIEQGQGLFSLTPFTRQVGKSIDGRVETKIEEGNKKIEYYEDLEKKLEIGGIILIAIGIGVFFIPIHKKKRK